MSAQAQVSYDNDDGRESCRDSAGSRSSKASKLAGSTGKLNKQGTQSWKSKMGNVRMLEKPGAVIAPADLANTKRRCKFEVFATLECHLVTIASDDLVRLIRRYSPAEGMAVSDALSEEHRTLLESLAKKGRGAASNGVNPTEDGSSPIRRAGAPFLPVALTPANLVKRVSKIESDVDGMVQQVSALKATIRLIPIVLDGLRKRANEGGRPAAGPSHVRCSPPDAEAAYSSTSTTSATVSSTSATTSTTQRSQPTPLAPVVLPSPSPQQRPPEGAATPAAALAMSAPAVARIPTNERLAPMLADSATVARLTSGPPLQARDSSAERRTPSHSLL